MLTVFLSWYELQWKEEQYIPIHDILDLFTKNYVYVRCFQNEHTLCLLHAPQSEISMSQTKKMTSTEATDTAALTQDNIPLSEMDKAAVLTLIREEVHASYSGTHSLVSVMITTLLDLNTSLYCFFLNVLSSNQIITKEIEVNEWKRKYEESRAEVFEMRYEASLSLIAAKIISVISRNYVDRGLLSFILLTGK